MYETYYSQAFDFSVSDTTVSVTPGVARIANTIMPFRGDTITFGEMADFGDETNKYQLSALLLQNFNDFADLTTAVGATSDSTREWYYPEVDSDSSNPYGPYHAIGLFAFYTPDGTSIELVSSSKIS